MMRLFPQPLAVTVAGLVSFWASGCGDPLASGDYAPPYVTLAGNVTGQPPSSATKMVVLWRNDFRDSLSFAGQLGVYHADLGTFTLGLNALPPAPAVNGTSAVILGGSDLDPKMRFAFATLLVFEDGNGNGQLDLVDSAAERSPDRVLGVSSGADLFLLLQGRPAAAAEWLDLFPTTSGFSLVQPAAQLDPTFGQCGFYDSRGRHETVPCQPLPDPAHPAQLLPLTQPITIDLPSDEAAQNALQGYACRNFWGAQEYADLRLLPLSQICNDPTICSYCTGEDCPLDVPPAGATVSCNADGTEYVYKTCTPDPTRCNTTFCHYGHGERLATDPPPVGWPCA